MHEFFISSFNKMDSDRFCIISVGAQWLSGRVLDSRLRGCGFEAHWHHFVVSLSKNINPSLVLVHPRKTRPFITEKLLMRCKESNQTKALSVLFCKGYSCLVIRVGSHILFIYTLYRKMSDVFSTMMFYEKISRDFSMFFHLYPGIYTPFSSPHFSRFNDARISS